MLHSKRRKRCASAESLATVGEKNSPDRIAQRDSVPKKVKMLPSQWSGASMANHSIRKRW